MPALPNVRCDVFDFPLLKLILRGCSDLPPAWGPIQYLGAPGDHSAGPADAVWDPLARRALAPDRDPMWIQEAHADRWVLPLDAASPWPARLALVTAWMVGFAGPGERVVWAETAESALWMDATDVRLWTLIRRDTTVGIPLFREAVRFWHWRGPQHENPSQTVPARLREAHAPVVALLLMQYGCEGVKERVAQAVGAL